MNAPQARTVVIAAATIALAIDESYAGIALVDGAPSHHLILLAGDVEKKHADALVWAKDQGGDLPTRSEQALLYAHLKAEFQKDWYWSKEQHASDASYAWIQTFSYGSQTCTHTSRKYRARAVRRVSIQ